MGLSCAAGPDRMAEHIRHLSLIAPVQFHPQCWAAEEMLAVMPTID